MLAPAPPIARAEKDVARLPTLYRCVSKRSETKRRAAADCGASGQADCGRTRRRLRGRNIWTCRLPTPAADTAANQVRPPFRPIFGARNRVLIHGLDRALSPHELAYQEALVQEREHEIREIETGIHELNEITRDLATIIIEQGTMIGTSSCLNP